ncbi:hypothetical protein SAMN04488070_1734 [Pseudidiomarina maritima]|uniref:Uncharacterized protein n=1 Tax=Pseudidiomarina maritima TaxID=519453 RepID=A0A1I6HFS9_9GAMM|nr:hypothetical protein SAMN04488070_1734 [Pseudidiomarina maritima]
MYKFLLGLIMSTMVILVACSPQEQETFTQSPRGQEPSTATVKHHAGAPSSQRVQAELPVFQL